MRTRALPLLIVAAIGLAGCGSGASTTDEPTATTTPATPTTEPAPADTPAPSPSATETAAVPTPDEQDPVVLAFDGLVVPIATTCAGADGAILATTEGEVTITLVREEGVALRYQAEGTTAETDEVAVDESEDEVVYSATLSSDQVEPLAITMTVDIDAPQVLPGC